LHISAAVYNESPAVDAAEVCHVYVERVSASDFARPVKELRSFQKVLVAHQQSRQVTITISPKYAMAIWDVKADAWLMERGVYRLHIGNSNNCTKSCGEFTVAESISGRGL
jgi:beta-glucosidase